MANDVALRWCHRLEWRDNAPDWKCHPAVTGVHLQAALVGLRCKEKVRCAGMTLTFPFRSFTCRLPSGCDRLITRVAGYLVIFHFGSTCDGEISPNCSVNKATHMTVFTDSRNYHSIW